jgi:excisionase family DNA binding protein
MYEIMTVGQLADYLQLDEQTIYRKANRGEIPVVRIGKVLRFKKDIIDGWLQLSSLQWNSKKRQALRSWTEKFAKDKNIRPQHIVKAIARRRKKP